MGIRRSLAILLAIATIGCAESDMSGGTPDARPGGGLPDARTGTPDARPLPDAPEDFGPPADAGPADAVNCATRAWRNLLVNGNLDSGPVGWTVFSEIDGSVITSGAPLDPHTPFHVAWLAGYNEGHEQLWQTVTVPPSTTMLRFRGFACFVTTEPTLGGFDWTTVSLHDSTSGALLEVLLDVTSDDVGTICDFVEVNAPITMPWAGRTIDLLFDGQNDIMYPTSFWWDSLALEAFACPGP
jgi:hypothetical protein